MTQSQFLIEQLWLLSIKIFISHELLAGECDKDICHSGLACFWQLLLVAAMAWIKYLFLCLVHPCLLCLLHT